MKLSVETSELLRHRREKIVPERMRQMKKVILFFFHLLSPNLSYGTDKNVKNQIDISGDRRTGFRELRRSDDARQQPGI